MMIDNLMKRIDLGVLSETLLYGDLPNPTNLSHEERIKAADNALATQLLALHLEDDQLEAVREICFEHQSAVAAVYVELGMQAGVALYRKLRGELPDEELKAQYFTPVSD